MRIIEKCKQDVKYYEARTLFKAGFTVKEVAKELGISELRVLIYKKIIDADKTYQ